MDSRLPQSDLLLVLFIGISIMLLLASAFALFFYFSQQRFQAQALKAQELEIKHQQQLLFNSIAAQEQERQRLARELHDGIGSKLNVINLGLHRLKKSAPGSEAAIAELFGLVANALDNARRIAHDLLPPTLEQFGLATALEELCEAHQGGPIAVHFALEEAEPPLADPTTSLNLYRAAQELMSNSFKYSQATQIDLGLRLDPQKVLLSFRDNGKGFDPQALNRQNGLGLQNIESRMRMIGAAYELESAPGKGVFFQAKKLLT